MSMTQKSTSFEPRNNAQENVDDAAWYHNYRETSDPGLQMGLIIADMIEQFRKECEIDGTKFPAPLDIFETSAVSILSDTTKYMRTTKPEKMNYKTEGKLLHKLSDIRSELFMILDILGQQKSVLDQLLNDRPANTPQPDPRRDPHPSGWLQIKIARETLDKYEKRVKKIDGDAERVEKAVQDQLDLKRTYASVRDAHSSLVLSQAVSGFTVITIFFLRRWVSSPHYLL